MFRYEEDDDDLLTLVEDDLEDEVAVLLESGADVDFDKEDEEGNTALHLAVCEDHLEMVFKLLTGGANITKQNRHGQTPLHLAAQQGNFPMIKYLLEKHVHNENEKAEHDKLCRKALCKKDNHKDTPLHIAARKNDWDMMRYLLQKEANVLSINAKGETALELAIFHRNISAIKYLVSNDSRCLNIRSAAGYTPLQQAVILGEYEIAKWLLDHGGANIFEESSHYNVTALTLAAKNPNKAIVCLLLSRGAGIKADLTGVDLSGIDLKHYVFIGAEDNGATPIQYEGIKTASELHEAKLKGVRLHYRALCRAITARLIDDPENKELLKAQETVNSISKGLAARYAVKPIQPLYAPEESPYLTSISCKRT